MKTKILILTGAILFLSGYAFGQCGGETYTIVNQCPNQQPQVSIDGAQSSNINYSWFSLTPKSPGPGYDTLTLGTGYNITYPGPLGSGGQTIYYQKEVETTTGGPTALPGPINPSSMGNVPSSSDPYQMTVTSAISFKLNYITVAIHSYSCQPTDIMRIQVQVATSFSQWYYFKCSDLIATSNGSVFLVKVPVYQSSTQLGLTAPSGTSTIRIYSSIGGTATKAVDAFEWFSSSSFSSSYTVNSGSSLITINYGAAASTISGQANKVPGLFDWDITSLCPVQTVNITPNSIGCCTPSNVSQPTIASSSGSNIINSDPISPAITLSTALQSGFYYQWYKDGVAMGASYQGANLNSISVTTSGKYSVLVAENSSYINKTSCVKSDLMWVQKRILFAEADNSTICLGESTNLLAKGATGSVAWTPTTNLSSSTSVTPVFTPTSPGTYTVKVTGEVPIGNQIINGDFEQGNVDINPSSYYTYVNPSGAGTSTPSYAVGYPSRKNLSISPGNYTINSYVFWPGFQAWLPGKDHTTGSGNFLYTDAAAPGSSVSGTAKYLWSQNVVVEPNTSYEFAAWIMNINAEADTNYVAPSGVTGINPNPASNPLPLIMLYINDVPAFTTSPTLLSTVDLWQKISTTWNSGSTSGTVTLKLAEVFTGSGTAGHDFGLDDISFGAPGNQTDSINITVNDCYYINATSDACDGDSVTITASTNGVFQYWRNTTTGTPSTVNIAKPTSITTKVKSQTGVSTSFTATASFIFNNEIQNGDFSAYNSGFSSTYSLMTNPGGTGMNPGQYVVGSMPTTVDNTFFVNKTDHTTGASTATYYVGDSRWDNTRNVSYKTSVAVTNGVQYGFSGWFANIEKEFLKASPDTTSAAVYPNGGKTTHLALYVNNQYVSRIDLPLDTAWHNFTATWTANTTGTVNIELRSLNIPFGSYKSGFAMDDLSFGSIYTSTKTVNVTTPACSLPVRFISFDAYKEDNAIELQWTASDEINTGYFIVERSTEGLNFESVGQVKASENGSFVNSYYFRDNINLSGTLYYRLKEVDKDGSIYYSEVKTVNNRKNEVQVYPNPSQHSFTIKLNASEVVKLMVLSVEGVNIAEYSIEPGNSLTFGEELTKGVYIVEVIMNDGVKYMKVVKE